MTELVRVPAFVDLHVHFREPGFPEKEDIESGVKAAIMGGYRAVCMMPNTKPVVDNTGTLLEVDRRGREVSGLLRDARNDESSSRNEEISSRNEESIARNEESSASNDEISASKDKTSLRGANATKQSSVSVFAASAMTLDQAGKELVDFDSMDSAITLCRELTGHGVCGITEDGKTLYDYGLMEKVCEAAVRLGLPVMNHAEPEADIIERDIGLARQTGARFHFQHISLAESVELIRAAKEEGLPVTCETAPHYFALTEADADISRQGTNAKMNPPLRTEEDRLSIIDGIIDGTIDCIATDHAPHEAAAKELPFAEAANGIIGLETAFPVSYTLLVMGGLITFERLIELMSIRPAEIISLPPDDIYVGLDLDTPFTIDASAFQSKGRNTPFDGMRVYGRVCR